MGIDWVSRMRTGLNFSSFNMFPLVLPKMRMQK
jgi:hypothetical protein